MPSPIEEIKDRISEIRTRDPNHIDDKELGERTDAAQAYAGESERHFIEFLDDCVKQSVTAMSDIRATQQGCYDAYQEKDPDSFADKAEWQSKIIVPKPNQTVQFGAASLKKAFSPDYLTVENAKDEKKGQFWQKLMARQTDKRHANFVLKYVDAATMALAVGQSMEIIPRWAPGRGLEFTLIEPWKIHRDPDAPSRDPQGGMYWVHQEWLDYFVLRAGEKNGRYRDVDKIKDAGNEKPDSDDPFMSKEAIAARKRQVWQKSRFRRLHLTSEYWGQVLSPRGEMLLPSATFTAASGRIIQPPRSVPYQRHRWPGVGFSPMPDLLQFGGRGLLEGVLKIWDAMNTIMNLHQDYLVWTVNPSKEINVDALDDPEDVEDYPGHTYLVRDTVNGQQAVRVVERRSRTNDILSNVQYHDQQFQRGAFVTDAVQGLPGYRQDITFRESSQNLDQAMSVYALMGENLEAGAIQVLDLTAEIIREHASYEDLLDVFTEEELAEAGVKPNPEAQSGVSGIPEMDGSFHVSGIQALMRDNETLRNLREIFFPLAEQGRFAPYLRPYQMLKAVAVRVNLTDEDILIDEEQARALEAQLTAAEGEERDAQQRMTQIGEALGTTDLAGRVQGLEDMDRAGQRAELDMAAAAGQALAAASEGGQGGGGTAPAQE